MDQGIIPDDWKTVNVVPIFKKGDHSKAENYRPVSLTVVVKLISVNNIAQYDLSKFS